MLLENVSLFIVGVIQNPHTLSVRKARCS